MAYDDESHRDIDHNSQDPPICALDDPLSSKTGSDFESRQSCDVYGPTCIIKLVELGQ